MLTAHHLHKSHNIQPILDDVSLSISARDRIGLIGPNGCGKTTLLRILAGEDRPDSGTILHTRAGLRIGYLHQGLEFPSGATLTTVLHEAPDPRSSEESILSALADSLSKDPGNQDLQEEYDSVLTRFTGPGAKPESVLGPLGLGDFQPDTPVSNFSGGQKTRLALAKLLLDDPHLLLLDEPTNHLDIAMLIWLEGWLKTFNGAALIVSHDRAFLDNAVQAILELDPSTHQLKSYPGNYTEYLDQKLTEREHQLDAWQDQQGQIAQLRAAATRLRGMTRMKKGGKADSGDKFATGFFGNRATKGVAGRAKHLEARIQRLLNEEKIDRPRPSWQLKLDFGAPTHLSRDVLITRNLAIGYHADKPLATGLNLHIRAGQRIAMTGENGSGKTTLIRTITSQIPPLAGEVKLGASIQVGYLDQEQNLLDTSLSGLEIIQKVAPFNETEARHFLHFFLFSGDDPLRSSSTYSYGERARLMLALLVAKGCNFLVLDEPINHLDIPSRIRFEQALGNYRGAILAVVHDRYFIENFAEEVWVVQGGKLQRW